MEGMSITNGVRILKYSGMVVLLGSATWLSQQTSPVVRGYLFNFIKSSAFNVCIY